jgi:small subunit ribosomal protein S17
MKRELKSIEKEQEANSTRGFVGAVVRLSSPKTIVVEVVSYKVHPKYRKKYKSTKRYLIHDEANAFSVGDRVMCIPSRPHSKKKRFEVVKKV